MRHKYSTPALVLGRSALSEASTLLILLTPAFGLIRVRAQGLRKPGAKLAAALQTFSECDVMLIAGKDGWRLAGALLDENLFQALSGAARPRAGRVASLILRLVGSDARDHASLYETFGAFLRALPTLSEEEQDAAECLAALRVIHLLGLDDGTVPGTPSSYRGVALRHARENRRSLVDRINRGLVASGL